MPSMQDRGNPGLRPRAIGHHAVVPLTLRASATVALLLSAALASGCSSSSDGDATTAPPAARATAPATTPSTGASTPAPTVPTLVNGLVGQAPSGCIKGATVVSGTNAYWQPFVTAQGGDVTIVKARLKGRGVTLAKAQTAAVTDPDQVGLGGGMGLPYPLDTFSTTSGADLSTLRDLARTPVAEGESVLPVLGLEIDKTVDPRGARLNSVVITYRSTDREDAIGRATVELPFEITWANPGKPCF